MRGKAFLDNRMLGWGGRHKHQAKRSSPLLNHYLPLSASLRSVARMERSAIREVRSHTIPVFRYAAYGLRALKAVWYASRT